VQRWLSYEEAFGERGSVSGEVRVRTVRPGNGLSERRVLAYLPPGYRSEGVRTYPVVYLQDGQNVFDERTSTVGQEWRADEAAEELALRGRPCVIVAVESNPASRMAEYGPWEHCGPGPWVEAASEGMVGGKASEYVSFLVDEIVPLVESSFRVRSDAAARGIGGSSMGGLVSLYAALSRPGLFGFCAALSPSLWFAGERVLSWVRERSDPSLRVYLDVGLPEGGPPVDGVPENVGNLRRLARELSGRTAGVRCVEDPVGQHNEAAWARRFPNVLAWFLEGPVI
jgi:predicted alpha/beta superfamily hydrolase